MSNTDISSSDCEQSISVSDDSTEYVVEKILDRRFDRCQLQYLVKWKDWPEEDNTWEIAANLRYCDCLISSFERQQCELKENDLNIIYERKAKRLKIDPGIVLDSPFNRGFMAEEILNGFNTNGEISFLIKFWHLNPPLMVPSCVAYVEIPQMILRFYEKHSNLPSSLPNLDGD